jgi:hypothetical protein
VKRRLAGRTSAPAWLVRRLLGVLARAEAALAAPREVTRFVEGVAPDAIVVSPLIDRGAHQTDYVKAGFELGLPTALLVTSWDNLTSKGRIRVLPDRVVVWNETQAHEAAEYHDVPRERIVLTGAQQFDRWFERRPSTTRPEFLARFDLPGDRPFILFTCSTRQKTAREAEPLYVRRWLEALRVAQDPELRNAAVLIRPHPTAASRWEGVELEDLGPVRIWRRERPLPVAVDDRADYFDALYHCSALVAINSTSMIEAAIVDRPVHTIAVPEFAVMQHDLMHFHYLLRANGGFLREASTFEEHTRLLSDDLRDPGRDADARRRFVDSFIRPPAGKPSATAALADAMLEIPDVAPSAARTTLGGRLVVAALSIAFRLAGRARIRPLLARGI